MKRWRTKNGITHYLGPRSDRYPVLPEHPDEHVGSYCDDKEENGEKPDGNGGEHMMVDHEGERINGHPRDDSRVVVAWAREERC